MEMGEGEGKMNVFMKYIKILSTFGGHLHGSYLNGQSDNDQKNVFSITNIT